MGEVALALVLLSAFLLAGEGVAAARAEKSLRLVTPLVALGRPKTPGWRGLSTQHSVVTWGLFLAPIGGMVGSRLAGITGLMSGAALGAVAPRVAKRRMVHRTAQALEAQLAELVEAWALAIRSGLSVGQALESAAAQVQEPMASLVGQILAERRVGTPFEALLRRFGEAVGSEEAKLLVLVVTIHRKTGGNLARALEELAATIRYRLTARRELRALTAQGRISGAVLGFLPIGFFLVLALTSQRELAPVYRSAQGSSMIVTGLLLEALAYVWIRRLLRVRI